jgi:DNA-binding response OmpR family regulator
MNKPSNGFLITLVDDDPALNSLFTYFLKSHGFTVKNFFNAKQCIKSLEDLTDIPNILIIDMILPDLCGIELIKSIRENLKNCSIPAIIISAKTDNEWNLSEKNKIENCSFLTKPFPLNELILNCEKILQN